MSFKKIIKETIQFVLPSSVWLRLIAVRSRKQSQKLLKKWGCLEVNRKLLDRFGNRSLGGLFPRLILPEMIQMEQMGPFILGTYEEEISPWFIRQKERSFSEILDVGSKFGFYAVGLATWHPNTPVIAFDTDPWAQKATLEVARANGVKNVSVFGYCSVQWLAGHLAERAFIVCDCEGFEFELLDPQCVPALKSATMIVESHDGPPWEKHLKLINQFKNTHRIEEVSFKGNNRIPSADISFLSDDEKQLAVGEPRVSYQKWLLFEPL